MEEHQVLKSPEPDQLVTVFGRQVVNHVLDSVGALGLQVGSQSLILQEHNMKSPDSLILMVNWMLICDVFVSHVDHSVVYALCKILGILAREIGWVVHPQVFDESNCKADITRYLIGCLDDRPRIIEGLNHNVGRFSDLDSRAQMN